MSRLANLGRMLLAAMAVPLVLTACGGGSGTATSTTEAPAAASTTLTADHQAVEAVVRASIAAENSKDAKTFLAIWTDKGLAANDSGSRQEIESGKSEGFGREHIELLGIRDTTVTGDTASTTVDVSFAGFKLAKPLYRAKLPMIRSSGKWLIDGFEFLGGPPPKPGTRVVGLNATDYAFAVDTPTAPADFAFRFTNAGKEQHELTLFKGPDGVSVATAKAALANVDGQELNNVPPGYQVDHVSFTEPGQSFDVSFAGPLPKGTYVLTCFIPQGGLGESGPVNPKGKPHIQLGMITLLTVE